MTVVMEVLVPKGLQDPRVLKDTPALKVQMLLDHKVHKVHKAH
jgi:hypothetical protein